MLFYVSLFIACVISAFLVLYLYHALADVGKAFYRGLLPSSKDNVTSHTSNARHNSTVNVTPTPWGWNGNDHEARADRPKSTASSGKSGLDDFINKHTNETTSVGWPYREEESELAGKAERVARKTAPEKARLRTNNKQPWGW